MERFYLTFGVQYRHEPHPHWPGANPDGWVLILAATEEAARDVAVRCFGRQWSTTYDAEHFDENDNQRLYYPRGVLATITVNPDSPSRAVSWVEGVGHPTPRFTPSDPTYHGVEPGALVAVRVEGILRYNSDAECIAALGYEAEHFHPECAEEGRSLFKEIHDEDQRVMAMELDWAGRYICHVCQKNIVR